MKRKLLLATLTASMALTQGFALERAPWYGNDNEFEVRTSYEFQTYDKLDTSSGSSDQKSDDQYLNLSLGLATMGEYHGEVEMTLADTEVQSFGLESLTIGGRTLFLNDLVGDPVSVSSGGSLTLVPSSSAIRDPGNFHHSYAEAEVHVAAGKETSSGWSWDSRLWGFASLGAGNSGSPWLQGYGAYERNFDDTHYLRAFADGRYGFGGRKLESSSSFNGYRSLAYQTIDAGVKYSYSLGVWGRANAEYSYRVLSQYAPEKVNRLELGFFFPFAL
ncbi:MAG: hypothetical protein ACI9S8_001894 [Chlamydiales bacterium]|jgi:hypothetical protein